MPIHKQTQIARSSSAAREPFDYRENLDRNVVNFLDYDN
jgi:hypothetical protein